MAGTSSTAGSETIATTKADFSNGDSTHWQAISYLAISSGPTVAQTMYHDYDALEITTQSFITGTHDWDDAATETTIKVAPLAIDGTVKPITFKTNYSCTAGVLGTNTEITEYNAAESDYTAVNDFKVKCYSKTSFGLGPTSTTYSQLNNLADHWTSLQISQLQKTENGYFRFNVNLPDDNHVGLLLVYVNSENGTLSENNYTDYIRIEDKTNSLAICNKCTNIYAMSTDGKYEFGW